MGGVGYSYWHLCRSGRTVWGPRQQVVVSLGELDEREFARLRVGQGALPGLLRSETPAQRSSTASLSGFESLGPDVAAAPRWEEAGLTGLRVERSREFGEIYLALSRWHRSGLEKLLAALEPEGRESVV